ncbi:MAG: LytR C-terminal domain-containing protein [Patescibacteria group bacterium]
MGISDDIKPKKSLHTQQRSIDVPVFSNTHENNIDLDSFEPEEKKMDPKSLEKLENDFFDYEYKHENEKQPDKKGMYIDKEEKKPASKSHHRKKSSTKATFWFITLALLGLLIWQNYPEIVSVAKNKFFKDKTTETVTDSNKDDEYYTGEKVADTTAEDTSTANTTTETTQETATATPTIDKANIIMEVLNGNGIKGSADTIRDQLITAGFKVSRVTNAKNFNYATSMIYFKTGKDAEANLVKETLTSLQTTTQNSDSIVGDYDVIVVIGAK